MPAVSNAVSELCETCPLAKKVNHKIIIVPPKWHVNKPLKYMIVGEAPGMEEIRKGQPFIGPSGRLLNGKRKAVGIDLDDCLIANTCWCPPRDDLSSRIRTPEPAEANHCIPHTFQLIQKYRPKIVVAVGGIAVQALTHPNKAIKITTLHGKMQALNPSLHDRYMALRDWMSRNLDAEVAGAPPLFHGHPGPVDIFCSRMGA